MVYPQPVTIYENNDCSLIAIDHSIEKESSFSIILVYNFTLHSVLKNPSFVQKKLSLLQNVSVQTFYKVQLLITRKLYYFLKMFYCYVGKLSLENLPVNFTCCSNKRVRESR